MKKILTIFFIFIILNMMVVTAYGIEPEDLQSRSAILINADDGRILFEKNANDKMQPASITKIMLMVLISERMADGQITLDQEMTISENAAGMGGSQIYLEAYEVQTVENMLKAISMRSANDASVAMAEFMYGSEESCVKAMNEKAKELGMKDTVFTNVTGLPDPEHLTTANDIAIMTRELLKYNYMDEYMLTWMDSVFVGKEKDSEQVLVNTNRLINNYNGLLAGKTGYTTEAKYCLSAAARRNDTTLIAVVLGCDNTKIRFDEVTKLLNEGFANYKNIVFHKAGDTITTSPVYCGKEETINIVSKENINYFTESNCKPEDFNLEYVIDENLKAPLNVDKKIGRAILSKDGRVLGEFELYPGANVEKENLFKFFINNFLKTTIR
ncbi:MAG TPA: D-alanyl-D-alanine carboxypeptidase family protein [Sedimentibacter sp.]|jgi:D-alanyl-D-alanine carboxypeptidase (penicillin-binding protein 5/6)|nr:D-alanyl-D-alanine carboxypeptidase [Sedimentibacter sp.]HAS91076.1 D-alanyl-D-alanine carboxypeptidase [Clostridiales bacterium]HOA19311.1 D-alanyl-D-alanine carboxypeptidase family protein [Sedimentibacter sp.]HOG62618.1 D-alanyl-D-alanine carboxypeptidase family protein [Sedimentibacter sp.]HPB78788.1 D-alanyl-D-alanine carboxypeptidase family protein [Sedimentibacter sp.]